MTSLQRVLWITAEVPDVNGGGGNIRQAHLLDALSHVTAVDLLLVGSLPDGPLRRQLASVTELPLADRRSITSRTVGRLHTVDLMLRAGPEDRWAGGPQRRAIADSLPRLDDYDAVSVEHAALADIAKPGSRPAWSITLQSLTSVRTSQALRVATSRRQSLALRRELQLARGFERTIANEYDGVVTVSSEDQAAFPGRSAVVPNGVDLDRYPVSVLPGAPVVIMTATLSYLPNVEGALWFASAVWPEVLRQRPDAVLRIVGRQPVADVLALGARPGISVHPDVPDTLPYLVESRVAVVPVRIGSGTRLKALEAMAARRPIVGTAIGLEGLGIVDGVHALVRDDGPSMAAAIVSLLNDSSRAEALSRQARQLAEAGFGWSRIGDQFVRHLDETVARRRGR